MLMYCEVCGDEVATRKAKLLDNEDIWLCEDCFLNQFDYLLLAV